MPNSSFFHLVLGFVLGESTPRVIAMYLTVIQVNRSKPPRWPHFTRIGAFFPNNMYLVQNPYSCVFFSLATTPLHYVLFTRILATPTTWTESQATKPTRCCVCQYVTPRTRSLVCLKSSTKMAEKASLLTTRRYAH